MTKDDKNKKLVTDQDIEDMLDNATSFSGEPMTEHDRKVIRRIFTKAIS
ncbi:hypothetical protein [Lactobacillus gasseri]